MKQTILLMYLILVYMMPARSIAIFKSCCPGCFQQLYCPCNGDLPAKKLIAAFGVLSSGEHQRNPDSGLTK